MSYCSVQETNSCFENIISLRGACENKSPTSGIWLDDVGISLIEINQYLTKEYESAEKLFLAKKNFAIKNVTNSIHTYLQPRYKAHSIITGARAGQAKENQIFILGEAGFLKGINVELCNHDSYLDLFISSISLFTDFTGTVPVYVYDLIQNKLIDTISVDTVAGEISQTFIDRTYKSERKRMNIIFVYDSTAVNSYKTTIGHQCTDCSVEDNTLQNQYTIIRSVKIASALSKNKSNIQKIRETGGMSLEFNISCNHEDYLCNVSNMVALPIAYRTAYEVMQHAIGEAPNFRTNTATTINSTNNKERFFFYKEEFTKSINNVLSNILMPQDEKCFVCNQKSQHKITLP